MQKLLITLFVFMCLNVSAFANGLGFIYEDSIEPGNGTTVYYTRKGEAACTSFFGLVGSGDCGLKTAMQNGNIKQLSFYDTHTLCVLGFRRITTRAYGK